MPSSSGSHTIDLELLRRFLAVAEALNFRQAAKRLGISQPPLSRSINQLEQFLGTKLLQRGTRGVSLTVAGLVLLNESPRLLEHAEMVQLVTQHSLESKRINVGFLTMALYRALPAALTEFRMRWPGVDLRLEELSTGEQYKRLQNGTLDVGFLALDAAAHPNLAMRVIDRSRIVLAVPADWELARKKSISLAELAGVPLIASARGVNLSLRDLLELKCRAAGFTPNFVHNANQVYPILKLVEIGAGIGFVPDMARIHKVQRIRYVPVKDESFNVELLLGMLWVERTLPAALSHFIKCVSDVVATAQGKSRSRNRA